MERHILVTNDDGIEAPGIWRLAHAMSAFGRVVLVAPALDASGAGTMVTYRRDLHIAEVASELPDVRAFTVDGSPADCVLVGLRQLKEGWISVVASGINAGFNLGADLFFSGTCGAGLVASLRGLTALALSSQQPDEAADAEAIGQSAEMTARILMKGIEQGAVPKGAFVNVNIPARTPHELRGLAITRPSPGSFTRFVETRTGTRLQRQNVSDDRHAHAGTDIRAVLDGFVSLSPLGNDLWNDVHAQSMEKPFADIFRAAVSAHAGAT